MLPKWNWKLMIGIGWKRENLQNKRNNPNPKIKIWTNVSVESFWQTKKDLLYARTPSMPEFNSPINICFQSFDLNCSTEDILSTTQYFYFYIKSLFKLVICYSLLYLIGIWNELLNLFLSYSTVFHFWKHIFRNNICNLWGQNAVWKLSVLLEKIDHLTRNENHHLF